MYYDYSYSTGGMELLGVILFYVIYMFFAFGLGIALYVFRSLGIYAIAKNRSLKKSWMAWVPVLNQYLLGCISDQYQYVVKGRNKSRRKILLVLNIAYAVILIAILGSALGLTVNAVMGYVSEGRIVSQALGMMGLYLPLLGVTIAMQVFRFMATYDLYRSCDPRNSVMYLVLSIVIPVTEPFFIFFNRNKDDGMPPRKEPASPVWEAPAVEEPWVNE